MDAEQTHSNDLASDILWTWRKDRLLSDEHFQQPRIFFQWGGGRATQHSGLHDCFHTVLSRIWFHAFPNDFWIMDQCIEVLNDKYWWRWLRVKGMKWRIPANLCLLNCFSILNKELCWLLSKSVEKVFYPLFPICCSYICVCPTDGAARILTWFLSFYISHDKYSHWSTWQLAL